MMDADNWSCYDLDESDRDDDLVDVNAGGEPSLTNGGSQPSPARSRPAAPLTQELRAVLRKIRFIGRGAQGVLYEAAYKDPEMLAAGQPTVVVKRLTSVQQLRDTQGFLASHIRELALLRVLKHDNIIRLERVLRAPANEVCLVMERYALDLSALALKRQVLLPESMVKLVARSLLRACAYMAESGAVHRDIKPSNVGVMGDGRIVLADFGSARTFAVQKGRGTPVAMVTTLTFTAPEMLLGCRDHTPAVDVWGVGVTLAELAKRRPFFDARSQLELLAKIFKTVGTPQDAQWMQSLPVCESFTFAPQPSQLADALKASVLDNAAGLDFMRRLLDPDPRRRITATAALEHPWLRLESPAPAAESELAAVVGAAAQQRQPSTARAPSVTQRRAGSTDGRSLRVPAFNMLASDDDDDDADYELRF